MQLPHNTVVPRMDWDRSPWNRWSFQHIRELLPTAEVWRGDRPVAPLPQRTQDILGLTTRRASGATTTIARLLDDCYADGFLVLHRGAIIAEHYFNDMRPRTLHLSQSVAKSVTAMAAGCLVGRGLLDPAAPLAEKIGI